MSKKYFSGSQICKNNPSNLGGKRVSVSPGLSGSQGFSGPGVCLGNRNLRQYLVRFSFLMNILCFLRCLWPQSRYSTARLLREHVDPTGIQLHFPNSCHVHPLLPSPAEAKLSTISPGFMQRHTNWSPCILSAPSQLSPHTPIREATYLLKGCLL